MSSRKPIEFVEHPQPFEPPVYRAFCRHVVDADTFDVMVDLGLYQFAYATVRLRGVDTPEIFRPKSEEERRRGHEAKAFVEEMLLNRPCRMRTHRDAQTFGRFVADVEVFDGEAWRDLAGMLREHGFEKLVIERSG